MNRKRFGIPVLLLVALLLSGCSGASTDSSSTTTPAASAPAPAAPNASPSPLNDFDEALRFVRNGQYTYIWVVARKDGKPFTADDGNFLKQNAPQVVDWAKADPEARRFVGGTNFNLEEGNLGMLKKRFVMEDYSSR